jgi:hypothetical protein
MPIVVAALTVNGCATNPTSESLSPVSENTISTETAANTGQLLASLEDANFMIATLQISAAEASSSSPQTRVQCIQTLQQQRNDLVFAVDALADKSFKDPVSRIKVLNALTLFLQSVDQYIVGLDWHDDPEAMTRLSQAMQQRAQQVASAIEEKGGSQ